MNQLYEVDLRTSNGKLSFQTVYLLEQIAIIIYTKVTTIITIIMATFISSKELHANLSKVGKEVMSGTTYIVLKHSKPAYKMVPYKAKQKRKSYSWQDLDHFLIKGKSSNKTNLSQTYKKVLYG